MNDQPILSVKNISVQYRSKQKSEVVEVVSNVSFDVYEGKILGIVGESGAGKSTVGHSILSALKEGGESSGEILLYGKNILSLDEEQKRKIRGNEIAVIVQDAFASLNPLLNIYEHFLETIQKDKGFKKANNHIMKLRNSTPEYE